MSILVNKNTRVVVQGITGGAGSFHTRQMLDYGTNIVGGITPGKGKTLFDNKVPIFNTVAQAVQTTQADISIIFVPATFATDALLEAAESGVRLVVCITEGIPTLDMIKVYKCYLDKEIRLIGPNGPGIITPGETKIGIMPGYIHRRGSIGIISRSGTLTYEAVWQITNCGLGQSTCIGLGGDMVVGLSFSEVLALFQNDPETKAIVIIGEIGGTMEEEAADYIKKQVTKPVVSFIAGQTAPKGKRMGHAGAIISGGQGTAQTKIEKLKKAGVSVVSNPAEIGTTVASLLKK